MSSHNLSPLQNENRVVEIDIIRGFALFGVLLVNMTMIDATLYSYVSSAFELTDPLERFSALLIHLFAVGKFYTLFSMLFGLGFYYFMNKSDATQGSDYLFKRRLTALFCFGLLHLVFVWYGDILHVYAITGIFLLTSRNKDSKTLLKTSIMLFLLSTVMFTLFKGSGGTQIDAMLVAEKAYTQPSYLGMVLYRLNHELPIIAFNIFAILPKILSLFFFGYYIGKRQLFASLETNMPLIKRTWRICGVTSLICGISYTLIMSGLLGNYGLLGNQFAVVFDEVLTIAGALFYATSLILLYHNPRFKKIILPLKYTGKMALTNYLMQTICFTTFFYGYGFGLHGKIPYWAYFPIAVMFYMVQIGLSKWWLSHNKFGPMERIWRQFTYWQNQ